jgi:chromosome segregation ATPase
MQLLARTSRWTSLQRERGRERAESLMEDVKNTTKQRDAARRTVKRRERRIESKNKRIARTERRLDQKRKKVAKLRDNLRAERARPWSRIRRGVGRLLGRGRSASP